MGSVSGVRYIVVLEGTVTGMYKEDEVHNEKRMVYTQNVLQEYGSRLLVGFSLVLLPSSKLTWQ